MRASLITASVCLSMLMASGGYLIRGFNAEPVEANIQGTGGWETCNWRSCRKFFKARREAKRLDRLVESILR